MPRMPPTFRPRGSAAPDVRQYDRDRGTSRERGYSSTWDKASLSFKCEADNALCLGCRAIGRLTATEVTDHVVPHKGDPVLMWDRDNWQPACRQHHDVVKPRLEAMFYRGEIGKTDLRLDSRNAVLLTRELLR